MIAVLKVGSAGGGASYTAGVAWKCICILKCRKKTWHLTMMCKGSTRHDVSCADRAGSRQLNRSVHAGARR